MIAAGLIDAAVVGGVDSLCLTTLYGFHSLQLISRRALPARSIAHATACRSAKRRPSRCSSAPRATPDADAVLLLGTGESSDAYHMSSPHPEGAGARRAMQAALEAAGAAPRATIDYINLHGTGTPSNDSAESRAVTALFGTAHAVQLDQGRHRPHARRRRRARSGDLRARAAARA